MKKMDHRRICIKEEGGRGKKPEKNVPCHGDLDGRGRRRSGSLPFFYPPPPRVISLKTGWFAGYFFFQQEVVLGQTMRQVSRPGIIEDKVMKKFRPNSESKSLKELNLRL